jgi:hypothetical protein
VGTAACGLNLPFVAPAIGAIGAAAPACEGSGGALSLCARFEKPYRSPMLPSAVKINASILSMQYTRTKSRTSSSDCLLHQKSEINEYFIFYLKLIDIFSTPHFWDESFQIEYFSVIRFGD